VQRQTAVPAFDPEDLKILDDLGLVTNRNEYNRHFKAVNERLANDKVRTGDVVSFYKFDIEESFSKYVADSGRVWSLYARDIPDTVIAKQRDVAETYRIKRREDQRDFDRATKDFKRMAEDGSSIEVDAIMDGSGPAPIGGWKLYDAIKRD